MKKIDDNAANALRDTLISPNEGDSNGEAANVVDGLFAIARAVHKLAAAMEQSNVEQAAYVIAKSLDDLSAEVRGVGEAIAEKDDN